MARVKKAGPRPKPNRPTSKMSSSTVRYITMLKKGKRTYRNYKQRKPTTGGLMESDDDSRIRSVNKWSEADMQQAIEEFLKGGELDSDLLQEHGGCQSMEGAKVHT